MTTVVQSDTHPDYPPPQLPQDEPLFKLYYFNIRARGEVIRMIFHAVGEPFEDVRLTTAEWAPLKAATPFQTLPVLEFEGHQLAQSKAIARFLASEFGLRGKDTYEQGLVDSVAEVADDLLSEYLRYVDEDHPHHKPLLKSKLLEESLPSVLAQLDRFQEQHGRVQGYIVGDSLTYADLAVTAVLDQIRTSGTIDAEYLLRYRYATELRDMIFAHEGLLYYYNNRPKPTLPF